MKTIYDFEDFRIYLKYYYDNKKKKNPNFSYRVFSRVAQISDHSLYQQIVKGNRKLSPKMLEKFKIGLGLDKMEAKYFSALVNYNQNDDEQKKETFYNEMLSVKLAFHPEEQKLHYRKYYEKWYIPVIRNIIDTAGFNGDYESLRSKVLPSITIEQTEFAVKVLMDLKLIEKDKDGVYIVKDLKVSPTKALRNELMGLYSTWIDQGKWALIDLPAEKRHVSSMLVPLTENEKDQVIEYIESIRDRFGNFSYKERTTEPEKLYQLNIQFFPRSTEI